MVYRRRIPEFLVAAWPRSQNDEQSQRWICPYDMKSVEELTRAVEEAVGVSSTGGQLRWRIEATRDLPACLSEPDAPLDLLMLFVWAYKEYGEPYFAYVELTGAVSSERFEGAYIASFRTHEEFARQHHHADKWCTPTGLRHHIDWPSVAKELFRYEFQSAPTPDKGVFVYRRL